jgi:hypothetical protein
MKQSGLLIRRDAIFSRDGVYRYVLGRYWDEARLPYVNFICLNPSKAGAEDDDNTSIRVVDYAMQWKLYGSAIITNLYCFAATKPSDMKQAVDPIGPDADYWLRKIAAGAALRIAAWGTNGMFMNRNEAVLKLLPRPLHCLTITQGGHPHHPLRLAKSLTPQLWMP